jgi:hypothetical protein
MHTHELKNSPEIGKTYTCILNDMPLYEATIEKAQGCWATVKVVRPLPGKHEKQYSPGQEFDIKVQFYDFVEH